MGLAEEVKHLTGKRRHYFLLRVADVDSATARKMAKVVTGTYNSWMHNTPFVALHRQIDNFTVDYKHEAIQMLRRDNQLDAVILEGKIVKQMIRELETGEYVILKTNLAREVYSKLINDLDLVPTINLTWEQKMAAIFNVIQPGVGDGSTEIPEANRIPEGQRPEDVVVEIGQEDSPQATETTT